MSAALQPVMSLEELEETINLPYLSDATRVKVVQSAYHLGRLRGTEEAAERLAGVRLDMKALSS